MDEILTILNPIFESILINDAIGLTKNKCKSLVGLLKKEDFEHIFNEAFSRSIQTGKITEVEIDVIKKVLLYYDCKDFTEYDTEEFKNNFSKQVYDNDSYLDKEKITFASFDVWFKDYLEDIRYYLIEAIISKRKTRDIVELNSLLSLKKDAEVIKNHLIYVSDLVRKKFLPAGVRIIDDKIFRHSASLEEIEQYYNGKPLTWGIVASDGIIERNAYKTLAEEWIPPSDVTNMICIVSEAGEGKSSLAWKFIYDLFQKQENLIIHIKDHTNAKIWHQLENFWINNEEKPFVVLVDNVFRNEKVIEALQNMDQYIPMTILATSRTNEYRDKRLPFNLKPIFLDKPNYEEKKRILEELRNKNIKLDINEELLKKSVPFLVFMMEATHGKEFEEIIEDEIEVLRNIDKKVNQAYRYLCFTYQYEISFPKSVLEKLDYTFYNVENKNASRGIILRDEIRTENLRTRHPLIAASSSKHYGCDTFLINNLINSIDIEESEDRLFILYLFKAIVSYNGSNLNKILQKNEKIIENSMKKLLFQK